MNDLPSLSEFRRRNPGYDGALAFLDANNETLGISARTTFAQHEALLRTIASEILDFLEARGPDDYMALYVKRVRALTEMQARFNAEPSAHSLRDAHAKVSRPEYDAALLLSFLFASHRMEILKCLREYLAELSAKNNTGERPGKIVSVGAGTGYELRHMARELPTWDIHGYEIDDEARRGARTLLDYFHAHSPRLFRNFPFHAPHESRRDSLDAIVLCEILEHLEDPETALRSCGECLRPDTGTMFITMAVNIAQEDHIYWYPDLNACREQTRKAGLTPVREWIAPMSMFPREGMPREDDFTGGNYIAVVRKSR